MRLLFDQNCSPALTRILAADFPDSKHVYHLGLGDADDRQIWSYAAVHGLIIRTKDGDFADLSEALGFPPKVIWLRCGNCTTGFVAETLRQFQWAIDALDRDPERGVLTIRG